MIKQSFLLLIISLLSLTILAQKEQNYELPNASVYDLDGNTVSLQTLDNNGKPILIFTWAQQWCAPCVENLIEFSKHYEKWQQETGVEIIALNVEKGKKLSDIADFADRINWKFTVLADTDGDFMAKAGVTSAPLSLFLNKQLETVKSYLTYAVTPEMFYGVLVNIDKKKQYFNKKWQFTTQDSAAFYRIIKSDYSNFDAPFHVEDYYLNGQIQMKGNYSQLYPVGIEEGKFHRYQENGDISYTINYIQGKKHGIHKQHFSNGELNYEIEYNNDLPWNILQYFDKDGNSLNKGTLSNGNGKMYLYYDNGTISSEIPIKNGLSHGLYKNYNQQGILTQKINYKDGVVHGLVELYSETGGKTAENIFEDGSPIQDWKRWNAEGKTLSDIISEKLENFDFENFVENIDFEKYGKWEEIDALEDVINVLIDEQAKLFYQDYNITEWDNNKIFKDLMNYKPLRQILSTLWKYELIKYYKPFDRIKYQKLVDKIKEDVLSKLTYSYFKDEKATDTYIEEQLESITDEEQKEIAWTLVTIHLMENDSRMAKYAYKNYF